jgi:hypothetical protein
MPLKRTIEKAQRDKRQGKSTSTQAGEFVREEIDKIRHGEHGARSAKQAIAIGLSEARRAGVDLPPPSRGQTSRKSAKYAYEAGQGIRKPKRSKRRSRAATQALKREPRTTVSRKALSRQAQSAASRRTSAQRAASAAKAVRTKGAAGRSAAAKKAARTRKRRAGR